MVEPQGEEGGVSRPLDLDALETSQTVFNSAHHKECWFALIAELRATRAELRDAVAAVDSEFARAERAEAELGKMSEIYTAACNRAERAEAELADAKGIIVEQEADARYGRAARVAAWQDRALTAEAAIARALGEICTTGECPCCCAQVRAALDG